LALGLLVLAALAASVALSFGAAGQDVDPPQLYDLSPAEGALVTRPIDAVDGLLRFTVTVRASDAVSGVNLSTVAWTLDPPYESVSDYAANLDTNPLNATAWELNLTFTLPDGRYRLLWRVADYDGNPAEASTNFVVDVSAPLIEVTAPDVTTSLTVTVRFDIRDATTGVNASSVAVRYRTNCNPVWRNATFQRTALPTRVVGEAQVPVCVGFTGANYLQIGAMDNAGYPAWSPVRTLIVDVRPPEFWGFDPPPFVTVGAGNASVRVTIFDNGSGVNASSVEGQVSYNGGISWSPWLPAEVNASDGGRVTVVAWLPIVLPDGASVGVRWNATDRAGNGPHASDPVFFRVNGPPFVVSIEPAEGSLFKQYESVRFSAEFADPDADFVRATFTSDLDGYLGPADGVRRSLSVGLHNLTLTADDGHGHVVHYNYTVEVVRRPPPDPRPLIGPLLVVALMALGAWWALAPGQRRRRDDDKF
jgi:hypothetical protein